MFRTKCRSSCATLMSTSSSKRRQPITASCRFCTIHKPREEWNVLLRDNHPGYISWQDYEDNQKLLLENAQMKKNCARKSVRGGRALLTGLTQCGRCGRVMRVFYGMAKGNAHHAPRKQRHDAFSSVGGIASMISTATNTGVACASSSFQRNRTRAAIP
jgi:hypothetical protein